MSSVLKYSGVMIGAKWSEGIVKISDTVQTHFVGFDKMSNLINVLGWVHKA